MKIEKYRTYNVKETQELGIRFADRLRPGDIVAVEGPLGSGKTEFIRGIARYFDVEEIVTSPTFTFINEYTGKKEHEDIVIYHLDLYRVKTMKELEEIGFDECIHSDNTLKLVEWPENANGLMPSHSFKVKIESDERNEDERRFTVESQ